MRNKQ